MWEKRAFLAGDGGRGRGEDIWSLIWMLFFISRQSIDFEELQFRAISSHSLIQPNDCLYYTNKMLFRTLLFCAFTSLSLAAAVPPSTDDTDLRAKAEALCDNLCNKSGMSLKPLPSSHFNGRLMNAFHRRQQEQMRPLHDEQTRQFLHMSGF